MKFYPRKKDREIEKRSTIVDLGAEENEAEMHIESEMRKEKELKKKNEKKTFNSKK